MQTASSTISCAIVKLTYYNFPFSFSRNLVFAIPVSHTTLGNELKILVIGFERNTS